MKGRMRQIVAIVCTIFLWLPMFFVVDAVEVQQESEIMNKRLQNGSFEQVNVTFPTQTQVAQDKVPNWNTTAHDGKIEIFKENTGVYISGMTLTPTDGLIAAELNADEESTLYQNVSTKPDSYYEWGLDHRGRCGTDTMALIVGPSQENNPSKPSKMGRDQLMQMTDWLQQQGYVSTGNIGVSKRIIVYSKKFGANGTFQNNADGVAFSTTKSAVYTEEWCVWLIADSKNAWGQYGLSNPDHTAKDSLVNDYGNIEASDIGKSNYLYRVPAEQTETLFGFVSVDSSYKGNRWKTLGNLLDDIRFEIYYYLSGTTTDHGYGMVASGVIEDFEKVKASLENTRLHPDNLGQSIEIYIKDGIHQTLATKVEEDSTTFAGAYITTQDAKGNPVTTFYSAAKGYCTEEGMVCDTIASQKWLKQEIDGVVYYRMALPKISGSINVHYVFIKSPMITYDANGGQIYDVGQNENTMISTYNFKPNLENAEESSTFSEDIFIQPYTSQVAKGPLVNGKENTDWEFQGWKLVDGDGNTLEELLPGKHTVGCNYQISIASGEHEQTEQEFFVVEEGGIHPDEKRRIYNSYNRLDGLEWSVKEGITPYYKARTAGLTLIAQWKWNQKAIAQTKQSDDSYIDSTLGGTVTIRNEGAREYRNGQEEIIGAKYLSDSNVMVNLIAQPKENYTFDGWYDAEGNLISQNVNYNYVVTKGLTEVCYARFSSKCTQTFLRQIPDVTNGWSVTEDDAVGTLTSYKYADVIGALAVSKATASSEYIFVGWFDEGGNRVANTTDTLQYTTTGDMTYYARFRPKQEATVEVSKASVAFIAEKPGILLQGKGSHTSNGTLSTYGNGPTGTSEKKYGNTISTGFTYHISEGDRSINTLQFTITIPAGSYYKIGLEGDPLGFREENNLVLEDTNATKNKGKIYQTMTEKTLTYCMQVSDVVFDNTHSFVLDRIYAPSATMKVTANGQDGTVLTNENAILEQSYDIYLENSGY